MARKAAPGTGNIRKKTVTRKGKQYSYWEARYTEGVDPGTGRQIQRSITGKTQKEVAQKLKAALASLDTGTYIAPSKMTVSEWLDIWTAEYLNGVKPLTADSYKAQIKKHIRPALGAIKLEALNTHTIQGFYNRLAEPAASDEKPLSAKSIKNVHGILHKALQQAMANGYIRVNPSDACVLPKVKKAEIKPLEPEQVKVFMKLLPEEEYKNLFTVALFTGMRQSELLGLSWDNIDFENCSINVVQQLQEKHGKYFLSTPKSNKRRTVIVAQFVMDALQDEKKKQTRNRLKYADVYYNPMNLVFTDAIGKNLVHRTVVKHFKKLVMQIGIPDARFHDLRHTYAVTALQAGDDIKTVQENLGHATAAFTLDIYAHATQNMKQASASRMENYIKQII